MNFAPTENNIWKVAVTLMDDNLGSLMESAWNADATFKVLEKDCPHVRWVLEYRIDQLKRPKADLQNFFSEVPRRENILTIRGWPQAGPLRGTAPGMPGFVGNEEQRRRLYQEAIDTGLVGAIDIEGDLLNYFNELRVPRGVTLIPSLHVFSAALPFIELKRHYIKMHKMAEMYLPTQEIIPKIDSKVENEAQLNEMLSFMGEHRGKVVAVGMGDNDFSYETRVQGPHSGSCWTYAFYTKPSAPGQIGVNRLIQSWNGRDCFG